MFQETTMRELQVSPVKMIAEDWALLTAGEASAFNTMTVSWGGVGELWGKDVAFVFVRPQRYTYEFMEKSDSFTLSFFGGDYKKELGICGAKSGRDIDKCKETGLEPLPVDGAVAFKQAKTVLVCRKAAFQDLDPKGFLDPSIMDTYAAKDYHRMYVGVIEKVLVAE
mgnify:FL=1